MSTGGCASKNTFLAKLFLLFALISSQKTLLKGDREIERERERQRQRQKDREEGEGERKVQFIHY